MPVPNINTRQTAKGTPGGSGARTVVYRDSRGRTFDAKVVAPGAGNTLTLILQARRWGFTGLSRLAPDVPRATSMKQTNVYFNAWGA